jgi:hypothetical protein
MARYNFSNYLEYMKNNPNGYWFKRKLYGWGWVPVKWEGWLVTLGFVAVLLFNGFYLSSIGEPSIGNLILFFGSIIISIIILIVICYKTGEKPAWTWGK